MYYTNAKPTLELPLSAVMPNPNRGPASITFMCYYYPNVTKRYVRVFAVACNSVCRLSVCNVGAPYSGV